MNPESVLIVDDELDARNLLSKVLRKEGFEPIVADSGEEALKVIRQKRFAAVLLDFQMPGMDGLQTLEKILLDDPEAQVILVTSHGSIRLAVEAVRKGAHDFLEKPFDLDELRIAVRNAVRNYQMARENSRLRRLGPGERPQPYVLGVNSRMQDVWKMVDKVAASSATILLTGESGTGKEVVAKTVHQRSARREGPFIAMNCAALTRELIESELFGHAKGAFTGAIETRKGRFETADGGTLFLDEIGEIPLELQPKLLRVLQEGTFERVGDPQTRKVDVRILAATNRNLESAVREKAFREDLFYRLNVIHIHLPPLRERMEDLGTLVEFFVGKYSVERGGGPLRVTPEAVQFLRGYTFPGNIRELSNMLERATILCARGEIRPEDFALQGSSNSSPAPAPASAQSADPVNFAEAKAQFECSHLMRLLTMAQGNVSMAARLAGMDRNNFKDKMRKYAIQSEDFRE